MIDNFHYPDGKPSPLSNFFPSPIKDAAGNTYPTVEHFFQAMKTLDPEDRKRIAAASTPGIAKKMGGRKGIVVLRSDWEVVKLGVMRQALELKFPNDLRNPMTMWLLDTRDQLLVEGNTWGDRIWGVCNGSGMNWLGHLLMARRAELRGV